MEIKLYDIFKWNDAYVICIHRIKDTNLFVCIKYFDGIPFITQLKNLDNDTLKLIGNLNDIKNNNISIEESNTLNVLMNNSDILSALLASISNMESILSNISL